MTSKSLLDGPLDDSKPTVACRFGERCTRRECCGVVRVSSHLLTVQPIASFLIPLLELLPEGEADSADAAQHVVALVGLAEG